jgi:hypothetical protein
MMEVCTPSVKLVKVRYRYVLFAVLLRYISQPHNIELDLERSAMETNIDTTMEDWNKR